MENKKNTSSKTNITPQEKLIRKSPESLASIAASNNVMDALGKQISGLQHILPTNGSFINAISAASIGELIAKDPYGLIYTSPQKQIELESEVQELRNKIIESQNKIKKTELTEQEKSKELEALKLDFEKLQKTLKTIHVLNRIHKDAADLYLNNSAFSEKFQNGESSETVVISIDIRRSTELMLKARTPQLFADFITGLSSSLELEIRKNYGIFDKFTGDGILAFFPSFYSGEDAITRALVAAEQCHVIFQQHYNDSRKNFNVFIKDVGLGIGIDFGEATLVNRGSELTVVGVPVVYACRMSGAPAGKTILNQPALEKIHELHQGKIKITETEIDIKNEGKALAYEVELPEYLKNIEKPDWSEF